MAECLHVHRVTRHDGVLGVAPTANGCQECLPDRTDWVHLRRCLECGRVLCCNSSPQRHASAHAAAAGHPLVQSFEPEEDWLWCYPDDVLLEPTLSVASPSHNGWRRA